jgi:hypothetical protein
MIKRTGSPTSHTILFSFIGRLAGAVMTPLWAAPLWAAPRWAAPRQRQPAARRSEGGGADNAFAGGTSPGGRPPGETSAPKDAEERATFGSAPRMVVCVVSALIEECSGNACTPNDGR